MVHPYQHQIARVGEEPGLLELHEATPTRYLSRLTKRCEAGDQSSTDRTQTQPSLSESNHSPTITYHLFLARDTTY